MSRCPEGKGRGWGDHIDWVTLEEGQVRSMTERKPMMVILHRASCPACEYLQVRFCNSQNICSLSRRFSMVNLKLGVDHIPPTYDFQPDGDYYPRVMFFAPGGGGLIRNACHLNKDRHRFFYENETELFNMMNSVINGM